MNITNLLIRRACAAILDYSIYCIFLYVYFHLFGSERPDGKIELQGFHHLASIIVVWIILFPFMEDWFGYTLGKGLFDLKVVSNENKKISFGATLKRHLLDPVDFFLAIIIVFVVWKSKTPRRLGDLWGGTKVVKEE